MRKLRKVLIVSGHLYAPSTRKASIHFFADEILRRGAEVCFISAGASLLNRWRTPKGFYDGVPLNRWYDVRKGLSAFVLAEIFHPVNLRKPVLNTVAAGIYRVLRKKLPVEMTERIVSCDLAIIEAGPGVFLVEQLMNVMPASPFVYKANDLLKSVGAHPLLWETEQRLAPQFNLIAAAGGEIGRAFPSEANVAIISHGIEKSAFDDSVKSPYTEGTKNAVSVGSTLFDPWLIETLAESHSDWSFHVFGAKLGKTGHRKNVYEYGERSFSETIPFIKFANLGLAPYKIKPSEAYLAVTSLKMLQYAYCGLPVLAPEGPPWRRTNVVPYLRGSRASVINSFNTAIRLPRAPDLAVPSWEDVVTQMLGKLDAAI